MSWHCIPVALIACGAFVIAPIPHIGGFVRTHPLPACHVQACHMVWEPDARPASYVPGLIYRPAAPYVPDVSQAPDNRLGIVVVGVPSAPVSVNEPSTLALFLLGLVGLTAIFRHDRR